MENTIKKIELLFQVGKLKEVIKCLLDLGDKISKINYLEVQHFSSIFSRINREFNQGLITYESKETFVNRVSRGLLEIFDNIKLALEDKQSYGLIDIKIDKRYGEFNETLENRIRNLIAETCKIEAQEVIFIRPMKGSIILRYAIHKELINVFLEKIYSSSKELEKKKKGLKIKSIYSINPQFRILELAFILTQSSKDLNEIFSKYNTNELLDEYITKAFKNNENTALGSLWFFNTGLIYFRMENYGMSSQYFSASINNNNLKRAEYIYQSALILSIISFFEIKDFEKMEHKISVFDKLGNKTEFLKAISIYIDRIRRREIKVEIDRNEDYRRLLNLKEQIPKNQQIGIDEIINWINEK